MKNFDGKKKVLLFALLGVFLLIGTSYAIWQLNFTQESSNVLSVACFSVTYSEQDNISLLNTYPMLDSEGSTLTPYQVTIKNNCNEYGAYQVNLEVLNSTTLDSGMVKVMFDGGTPQLLTSYTAVEKTLSDATSAYKMTIGFLHPNEEKTYTLRLWVDENVTLEDHIEGKRFASKITITNTYKEGITPQEKCQFANEGDDLMCNIIAQADSNNDKCLKVDENGMIINPNTNIIGDEEEPLICAMEDDYGTSYYLRGNHTSNNVKFANMCWKLVRITGTGGYKLLYNGDLDANGKCTTTSGNHIGFKETNVPLYAKDDIYGTSYTKEGNTYTLTDTLTLNWSTDPESIIGKYKCWNGNTTCASPNLFYIISKQNVNNGTGLAIDVSTNYAQIGTSSYLNYDNSTTNTETDNPALTGYMYNDVYKIHLKDVINSGVTILSSQSSGSSNYYYGDSISYSGGYYFITNQNGSNVTQLSWADHYTTLPGKYTCRSTSKQDNKTIKCTTAYKVLDTTTKTNYMIAEYLSGGRTSVGTIKLSSGYTDNGDGTYTLNSPIAEVNAMDWYNGYSSYNNYYVCEDYNQTTCNKLYKITNASQTSFGTEILVSNNYYYGSSFTYDNGTYTLNNTIQIWDTEDSTNKTNLNTHHYTCFNASNNTCQELYYIYYYSGTTLYYIKLNGNETGPQAVNKMLNGRNVNAKNSEMKKVIDWWYETHLKNTEYESYLEDTIFCNDRTVDDLGGWSETGSITGNPWLKFNSYNEKYYLKCPNKIDAFTVSDSKLGNGDLTYPIGLLTTAEHNLSGNYSAHKTNANYWTMTPAYFGNNSAFVMYVHTNGKWTLQSLDSSAASIQGVRPSISLKPGTEFKEGTDGTASNPYEVE